MTVASNATQYTDATMALAAHPLVTITGNAADAMLHIRGAVDLEIKIGSVDSHESYTPSGIVFQQRAAVNGVKTDSHGKNNFAPANLNGSTLVVHDRYALTGPEYHYEFFVLIQRASDGAIGVIDPPITHDN